MAGQASFDENFPNFHPDGWDRLDLTKISGNFIWMATGRQACFGQNFVQMAVAETGSAQRQYLLTHYILSYHIHQ